MSNVQKDFRKYVNFDLDTKQLKAVYPGKRYTDAYLDIKRFLKKQGFEHNQGSGYISKEALPETFIYKLVKRMRKELPWVKVCVKRFVHTDVATEFYDDVRLISSKR